MPRLYRPIFLLSFTIAVTATLVAQVKDLDGWGPIKWGMTVTESRSVLGNRASEPTAEDHKMDESLQARIRINNLPIGDITTYALIQTRPNSDQVAGVKLEAAELHDPTPLRTRAYSTLKNLLIQKYGPPQNEDKATNGRGTTTQTAFWGFPSSTITLKWMEDFQYQLGFVTLSYAAVDKAARGIL